MTFPLPRVHPTSPLNLLRKLAARDWLTDKLADHEPELLAELRAILAATRVTGNFGSHCFDTTRDEID